jgi:membrane protease YdiL (CAAX protease family)
LSLDDGHVDARRRPRHWGVVATLLWIVLTLLVSGVAAQVVQWSVLRRTIFGSPTDDLNPLVASVSSVVAIVAAFTVTAVKLRRGDSLTSYLAVRRVKWRAVLPDLGVVALVAALVSWVRMGAPDATDSLLLSQDLIVLYAVLLTVFVPLAEESMFRGFVMTGFLSSRWGAALAVPLSAAPWAMAHSDTSWTGGGALFVLGCALGVLRVRSNSILPGIVIHAANNLGALILTIARAP